MKRTRLMLLAAGTLAAATFPTAAHAQTKILMSGSTSVYPLTVDLIKAYKKKNPNTKFSVSQGGSDVGIGDVARKRVNIGASSRDQQAGDPGGLTFIEDRPRRHVRRHQPGEQHRQPVPAERPGHLRRQGAPLGRRAGREGHRPDQPQRPHESSGTQDAFRNIFMGPSLRVTPSASQKATNGLVQAAIQNDKNAIGYVDINFISGTHPVPYKGVACNLRNAKSGQYPGVRNFWYVTLGAPKGETKKFIDFARSAVRAEQRRRQALRSVQVGERLVV